MIRYGYAYPVAMAVALVAERFKGHLLWNSGRTVADYLEERADELVKDKNILELGAGAGLPSLICARRSARKVR